MLVELLGTLAIVWILFSICFDVFSLELTRGQRSWVTFGIVVLSFVIGKLCGYLWSKYEDDKEELANRSD